METFTVAAEDEFINKRIDCFVSETEDSLSRSQAQKLIESGNILVNGKNVKSNYKIRKNDIVYIEIPDP